MIPVSVIVVTKNEEKRIERCLDALRGFDEIAVVDSQSTDATRDIARACGAKVVNFAWNGRYPKKFQWCLDNLALKHDWAFFVDADEIVTPELVEEIKGLWCVNNQTAVIPASEAAQRRSAGGDPAQQGAAQSAAHNDRVPVHARVPLAAGDDKPAAAGYFVPGRYAFEGKVLNHGLRNNKLALLDRRKIAFPEVDDLDIPGGWEIEGHYQPVLKPGFENEKIGQLHESMLHYAYEDKRGWTSRHERYAQWEAGMNARSAWPEDPVRSRAMLKKIFRRLPFRGAIAFIHCYVFKRGFLDGAAGLGFALSRAHYYRMISKAGKGRGRESGSSTPPPATRIPARS